MSHPLISMFDREAIRRNSDPNRGALAGTRLEVLISRSSVRRGLQVGEDGAPSPAQLELGHSGHALKQQRLHWHPHAAPSAQLDPPPRDAGIATFELDPPRGMMR